MVMENLITSCTKCNLGKSYGIYGKRILKAFRNKDFGLIRKESGE
jgi:hypothetical protein